MSEAAVAIPSEPATYAESLTERRVVLPGGVLDRNGQRHRHVLLRELTGADEELLCDQSFESGARQVTAFLARAIASIEGFEQPIDEAATADILIGDRDYLLLRLRQMELGDHVHQVMRCPRVSCGKKVDVEFWISEIEVRRSEELPPHYRLSLAVDESRNVDALVRLPTGRDQEAIAPLLARNSAAANTRLFSRIVLQFGAHQRIDEAQARALSLRARRQLATFIAETSPGPDLYVDVQCPSCGGEMGYDFDLHGFFLRSGR